MVTERIKPLGSLPQRKCVDGPIHTYAFAQHWDGRHFNKKLSGYRNVGFSLAFTLNALVNTAHKFFIRDKKWNLLTGIVRFVCAIMSNRYTADIDAEPNTI